MSKNAWKAGSSALIGGTATVLLGINRGIGVYIFSEFINQGMLNFNDAIVDQNSN